MSTVGWIKVCDVACGRSCGCSGVCEYCRPKTAEELAALRIAALKTQEEYRLREAARKKEVEERYAIPNPPPKMEECYPVAMVPREHTCAACGWRSFVPVPFVPDCNRMSIEPHPTKIKWRCSNCNMTNTAYPLREEDMYG